MWYCNSFAFVHVGNVTAVKRLIADAIDVNSKDDIKWTALHFAASEGKSFYTSLFWEVHRLFEWFPGHGDTVLILLSYGAKADAEDIYKVTPLHLAAKISNLIPLENCFFISFSFVIFIGNESLVRSLIEHGAKVNAKTNYFELTPLHYAASYGKSNTDLH